VTQGLAKVNNSRDWQSLAYLLGLPALVAWSWMQASFDVKAYVGILVLVIGVCCISHNHAHVPIWRASWLNRLTDMWIGILQGQPVFLFQPAHVASHHRFNQGAEDLTRVARYSAENTLIGYLVFPFQVLPALQELRKKHLASLWREKRDEFWWVVALHVPLLTLWITVFWLDPIKATIYVLIPQLVGLHFLLASNYLQHAHAVAGSRYNHSRNFVGLINVIWFNVGYHTAHHENEKLHWTLLPEAHRDIASRINPALVEFSLLVYTFRTLLLGLILPHLRSIQLKD
jgi:fatty acid desaturase